MVWFKGLRTRKWSCRKPVASFVVNSWPEGGKLARLRYLQRLLPRTLLPLLLRCRFDLLRWWANIFLLSIKHTFVCSQNLLVAPASNDRYVKKFGVRKEKENQGTKLIFHTFKERCWKNKGTSASILKVPPLKEEYWCALLLLRKSKDHQNRYTTYLDQRESRVI